jgi:hypothetical protein
MKASNPSPNNTKLKHHNKRAEELLNTFTMEPQSTTVASGNKLIHRSGLQVWKAGFTKYKALKHEG